MGFNIHVFQYDLVCAYVCRCKCYDYKKVMVTATIAIGHTVLQTSYREIGGQKDYAVFGHCVIQCL